MSEEFFALLDQRIAQYDLLQHPFYKAWSQGALTRDDLCEYGRDYYHHVEAFPGYLAKLASRLEEGELRRAVLANLADETGGQQGSRNRQRAHSELWLDFLEGLSGSREIDSHQPSEEVRGLIEHFSRVAQQGCADEVLAAFYAYESQVPRVAKEKARGLRDNYCADEKTCGYFILHATADVYHSQVWRRQLTKRLKANPQAAKAALDAGQAAACVLWKALDGIERRRHTTLSGRARDVAV